ncbi:YbgC/FadM family acyl-CoA thioesterase [Sulfurospirillum sp. 1612]|uniref:YbgC/FadM family acyl-CoA thioesterase n=1 Tax=Sulfurospirillum sp. 1612 TaxID=3094835 RepID=UPI002F954A9D
MKIRVYYEDTDAGGIVYHANYLKFCERSRSELFFEQGTTPTADGGHFVIKHIDAEFLKSAKLGDLLDVKNKILQLRNSSMKLSQTVWRGDEKLFDMTAVLVFAKEGKPLRIDRDIRDFLTSLNL